MTSTNQSRHTRWVRSKYLQAFVRPAYKILITAPLSSAMDNLAPCAQAKAQIFSATSAGAHSG
eukprot:3128709-Pyramimonas_sp.AAC.1